MSPKQRFISSIYGGRRDRPSLGTVTSLANTEAMACCGAAFPEAHLDPVAMADLAAFCSLEAGFDMLFPVFSVVHETAALGADIDWGKMDVMPSVRQPLWREAEDISIPDDFEQRPAMRVILEALHLLKERYGRDYAIAGKTFGPWSLGFHLFGVENILIMSISDPDMLTRIMESLTEITVRSALAQIEAGADVLCLGDHCSRDMCSPQTYKQFLQPRHREISRRVPSPLVLHTCGDTSDRIDMFADTTLACFHYDTRVPAESAVSLAGGKISLMGGISNVAALMAGDEQLMEAQIRSALDAGVNVIGPECAIPLNTGMESLKAIGRILSGILEEKESGHDA
ncbi:MAG: uroporphyrinogen decarboxylase family protein [bacterium]|nr:uroporphyrinogen decarboxylase family protein [bacterium]